MRNGLKCLLFLICLLLTGIAANNAWAQSPVTREDMEKTLRAGQKEVMDTGFEVLAATPGTKNIYLITKEDGTVEAHSIYGDAVAQNNAIIAARSGKSKSLDLYPECDDSEYSMEDFKGDTFCISPAGEYTGGAFEGCKAMPNRVYEQKNCFFCPLFRVIFVAMDQVSQSSMSALAKPFINVLVIIMALYIAIITLNHVSQLTKQEAPRYLNTIIKQTFKFVIAFFLLMYFKQVYNWIINPLLISGMKLANELTFTNVTDLSNADDGLKGVSLHLLAKNLYLNILLFLRNIQYKLGFMQAVGQGLICAGGNTLAQFVPSQFGLGFQMIIIGAIIAVFALLLTFAFGFYLIDAVVEIGIAGALMPLLVLAWPFKVTAKYTRKGVDWLINSFMTFVMMALVISINFALIDEALNVAPKGGGTCVVKLHNASSNMVKSLVGLDNKRLTGSCRNLLDMAVKLTDYYAAELKNGTFICGDYDFVSKFKSCDNLDKQQWKSASEDESLNLNTGTGALGGIYDAIHGNDYGALVALVDIGGKGFLVLLVCCFFGFRFTGQATELASEFSGGAVSGIGSSIGTMAGSAVKSGITTATSPFRKAAKEAIGDKIEAGAKSLASGAVKLPFRAVRYTASAVTGGDYAKQTNHNIANAVDKFAKTNTTKQNKQQKATAQNLAERHDAEYTKRDKDGNREVKFNDGTSATISQNNKVKFNSNVNKRQKFGGGYAYVDSKTGVELSEDDALKRIANTEKRQQEYDGNTPQKPETEQNASKAKNQNGSKAEAQSGNKAGSRPNQQNTPPQRENAPEERTENASAPEGNIDPVPDKPEQPQKETPETAQPRSNPDRAQADTSEPAEENPFR